MNIKFGDGTGTTVTFSEDGWKATPPLRVKKLESKYHHQLTFCYPSLWQEPYRVELCKDETHNFVFMTWFKQRAWRIQTIDCPYGLPMPRRMA